jgi:toxin ParE1/3/4
MKIIKRRRATTDLVEIWRYTHYTWGSPQADNYIEQIEGAVYHLRENPFSGVDCSSISKGLRRLNVKRHRVFYRVHDDWIEIVRVLHSRMDVESQLEE